MSDENSFNESELDNIMSEIESLENELKDESPSKADEIITEQSESVESKDLSSSEPQNSDEKVTLLNSPKLNQRIIKLSLDQLEDVQVVLSINGQEVVFNLQHRKSEINIELEGGGSVNLPLNSIKKFAA